MKAGASVLIVVAIKDLCQNIKAAACIVSQKERAMHQIPGWDPVQITHQGEAG